MKLAIASFSGNVGKTTFRKNLLQKFLPGYVKYEIEDVNSGDDSVDLRISSDSFRKLAADLNVLPDEQHVAIDIGSSNTKAMFEHFRQLRATRKDIDFWLLPMTPATKTQIDAVNTAKALIEIQVPVEKIVFLMNMVSKPQMVLDDFSTVIEFAVSSGVTVINQCVLSSDIYEELKGDERTVYDLAEADTDWKKLRRESSGNTEALTKIGREMVMQDLAADACANLDAVWSASPMASFKG